MTPLQQIIAPENHEKFRSKQTVLALNEAQKKAEDNIRVLAKFMASRKKWMIRL